MQLQMRMSRPMLMPMLGRAWTKKSSSRRCQSQVMRSTPTTTIDHRKPMLSVPFDGLILQIKQCRIGPAHT